MCFGSLLSAGKHDLITSFFHNLWPHLLEHPCKSEPLYIGYYTRLPLVEDGDAVLGALREDEAEVPGRRDQRVLVGRLSLSCRYTKLLI